MRLALVPTGQHTLFMLVHQPESFPGWSDAPFAWSKVPPERRFLPVETEPSGVPRGYLLMLYLTDRHGIVHAIRGMSVTPRFTAALDDALREQARHADGFSAAVHAAEIAAAYRRWPRPEDMLASAAIVETVGLHFGP